jgi:hypothetical protein
LLYLYTNNHHRPLRGINARRIKMAAIKVKSYKPTWIILEDEPWEYRILDVSGRRLTGASAKDVVDRLGSTATIVSKRVKPSEVDVSTWEHPKSKETLLTEETGGGKLEGIPLVFAKDLKAFAKCLKSLKKKGVIDRSESTGSLTTAIDMVDEYLSEGGTEIKTFLKGLTDKVLKAEAKAEAAEKKALAAAKEKEKQAKAKAKAAEKKTVKKAKVEPEVDVTDKPRKLTKPQLVRLIESQSILGRILDYGSFSLVYNPTSERQVLHLVGHGLLKLRPNKDLTPKQESEQPAYIFARDIGESLMPLVYHLDELYPELKKLVPRRK